MVTTRPPKTIVKPTALGPVTNTDTKLLIYGLFQKGRVLAQDGVNPRQQLPDATAHRAVEGASLRGLGYASPHQEASQKIAGGEDVLGFVTHPLGVPFSPGVDTSLLMGCTKQRLR